MSAAGRVEAAERARDREARRRAQTDFDHPLVVEAGAGTGKTAVLTARIVAWALGPGWERSTARLSERAVGTPSDEDVAAETLRRVVAITFTEAAAAEMATRVARALSVIRRGGTPVGTCADALPDDADLRARRARALVGALDQLVVRTIHAFCRRLLAAQPLEAGLHPRFQIDPDGRVRAEVAREVVESHLATAYGASGDSAWLALADHGIGPVEVERALIALLDDGTPPEAFAGDPLAPERMRELAAALRDAAEGLLARDGGRLQALRRTPRAVSAMEAAGRVRELAGDAASSSDPAWLDALRDGVEPRDVKRWRDWERDGFGDTERDALGDDVAPVAAAAGRLRALVDHALAVGPVLLRLACQVLEPLLDEASELLRTRGVQGFAGLLRDTRKLLVSHAEVCRRVRGEIDQLLVDEFQDTDATQCEILAALALDGPAEERPGLFLVGDPKQSIYGWRNADLAAYEGFLERVAKAEGGTCSLVVNFRSVPAVLDEVERVVAPVMHERPGLQPRFERLWPSEARRDERGWEKADQAAVEHWITWGVDAQGAVDERPGALQAARLEARAVAADLRRLQAAGADLGRVALLFRAMGDFEIYLGALREAGVPFVVEREPSYYQRRECLDASALVRCVLDPYDQLALVTVLRSSLVGVPDAAWLPLWRLHFPSRVAELRGRDAERREALRALVARAASDLPAGVPGIERIAGWEHALVAFCDELARLRSLAERGTAVEFVEALRAGLPLEATEASRHLGRHRVAHLDRFYRDLVAALEESGGDVGTVLSRLRRSISEAREQEEGRPRDASRAAVQVLTIHKAKGLDFDHVYLLQLHKGRPPGEPRRTHAAARGGRWDAVLFGVPTPGFHAVSRGREAVDEHERVRTLYVAMTRARERLVLVGRPGSGSSAQSHADLVAARAPAAPDLGAWVRELHAAGGAARRDGDGVLWAFPALLAAGVEAAPAAAGSEPASLGAWALRDQCARLDAERARARAWQARPFAGTASEEADATEHALARGYGEESGERGERPPAPPLERRLALALGTAVHAALEEVDATAPLVEQEAAYGAAVEAALSLSLAPGDRPRVREAARALWTTFAGGPLAERLARIAPHVVARELPVLLEPDAAVADEPTGFLAGAIDLLYRDPDDGAWVVADYKTDAVAPGEALAGHAERYRRQGAIYVRAVQRALGLEAPPRFELWFLRAGRTVRVEPLAAGEGASAS